MSYLLSGRVGYPDFSCFCFTSYMMSWDPHGVERLEEMQQAVVAVGLDVLVHEAVEDVWRANRASRRNSSTMPLL